MQHEHRSVNCTSTIPVSSSSTSQRFNWTADCGEQWVQWTHWKEPVWEDCVMHLEVSIMKVMTWSLTLRWLWAAPPPSHHQQTQQEECSYDPHTNLWPSIQRNQGWSDIGKVFQPSILQFGESVWTGASVFRSEQTGALPYESSLLLLENICFQVGPVASSEMVFCRPGLEPVVLGVLLACRWPRTIWLFSSNINIWMFALSLEPCL